MTSLTELLPARLVKRLAAVFFPAALLLAVLPALPASAGTGPVKETFGSWYIGCTPNAGANACNVGAPGRSIIFALGPGGTGTLQAASNTGLCLAPASTSNHLIEWRFCSVTGVRWSWVAAGTTHYFVNQASAYAGLRLSGDSVQGDPLSACPPGGCGGSWTLQQWTGPS